MNKETYKPTVVFRGGKFFIDGIEITPFELGKLWIDKKYIYNGNG